MQTTRGLAAPRQGHIDALGRQLGTQRSPFKGGLAAVQGFLNLVLGGIDQGTGLRTLFRRQLAQGLHHLSQLAFLAQIVNPQLLQGIHIVGVANGLKRLRDQHIQIFHLQTPDTK
ncbi:hypothetical protein D3C84_879230 [compost metagenome]